MNFCQRMSVLASSALLIGVTGCSMIEAVTAATREKSLALGSDTWGGGGEVTAAAAEQPVPTGSFWFGRRKMWYISVKDKESGSVLPETVQASNSSLTVDVSASGISAGNSAGTGNK